MGIIYQDSFDRDWTTQRLLFASPGLEKVPGWQTGNALRNGLSEEIRLLVGSGILGGSYTSTEWAFGFTLRVEGTALPVGTGIHVPSGESRILQIGTHVGIRLIPAQGVSGFTAYSLGLYRVEGSTLVESFPFTGLALTVGETYHVQVKITVGTTGTVQAIIHDQYGRQVFSQSVSPVVAQGTTVQNGFASIFVLPGMTIGHLIVGTDLMGLALTVPLAPNAAGSVTGWTSFPSGSNWSIVAKEVFSQETYVQATGSSVEDSYNVQSPPDMPATAVVHAIQVSMVARAEYDVTPPEITGLWSLPSQSSTRHPITPAGKEVLADLTAQVHVIDQNPNTTAPFVLSELADTQIGVELL